MTDTCAVCGENPSVIDRGMPHEWTEYLVEERDLTRPFHGYRIPVCADCDGSVDPIRKAYVGGGDPHGDDDATALLDALVLDNLTDESPDAP